MGSPHRSHRLFGVRRGGGRAPVTFARDRGGVSTDATSEPPAGETPRERRSPRREPADTGSTMKGPLRIGEICPTCFTAKSLAGTCDTCD
jgi:hypothetical protein